MTPFITHHEISSLWNQLHEAYQIAKKTKEQKDIEVVKTLIVSLKEKKSLLRRMVRFQGYTEAQREEMRQSIELIDMSVLSNYHQVLKKIPYYERLNDIKELTERGWSIIPQEKQPVVNRIGEKLEELNLSQIELAKLCGTSRQSLSFINKQNPCSLSTALKLSHLFNEPVEELFTLTDNAWYAGPINDGATPLYINMATLEVMESTQMKREQKKLKYTHYHTKERVCLTDKKAEKLLEKAPNEDIVPLFQEIGVFFQPIQLPRRE